MGIMLYCGPFRVLLRTFMSLGLTVAPFRMLPSSAGTVVTVRIDVLKELEACARRSSCLV